MKIEIEYEEVERLKYEIERLREENKNLTEKLEKYEYPNKDWIDEDIKREVREDLEALNESKK